MPSYDYKCNTCESSTTLITGIDKKLYIPICSKCKSEMVRDYGLLAVRFKGKGFYSTEKGK